MTIKSFFKVIVSVFFVLIVSNLEKDLTVSANEHQSINN